jgi:hypothetical protein
MAGLATARSERRKHSRAPGRGLIAEIRGKRYHVLDISFGGMRLDGAFTVAGGLVDAEVRPANGPLADGEKAELRGRVERVDGHLTAVRFSNVSDKLAKLIAQHEAESH